MSLGKLRAALAALLVGGLAAGVLWVYAAEPPRELSAAPRAEAAPFPSESEPAAVPASTTPAPVSATPTPTPAPTEPPPTLEDLRASDAYIEFAETRRARSAPGVDRAYNGFGWDGGDGNYYEFANASTLWNEVVQPIRDDLLTAGYEHRGPILDDVGDEASDAASYVGIQRRAHGGLQVVVFIAPMNLMEGSELALRVHAVAINVTTEGAERGIGRIDSRLPPFTAIAEEYSSWSDIARTGIDSRIEQWKAGLSN